MTPHLRTCSQRRSTKVAMWSKVDQTSLDILAQRSRSPVILGAARQGRCGQQGTYELLENETSDRRRTNRPREEFFAAKDRIVSIPKSRQGGSRRSGSG